MRCIGCFRKGMQWHCNESVSVFPPVILHWFYLRSSPPLACLSGKQAADACFGLWPFLFLCMQLMDTCVTQCLLPCINLHQALSNRLPGEMRHSRMGACCSFLFGKIIVAQPYSKRLSRGWLPGGCHRGQAKHMA